MKDLIKSTDSLQIIIIIVRHLNWMIVQVAFPFGDIMHFCTIGCGVITLLASSSANPMNYHIRSLYLPRTVLEA